MELFQAHNNLHFHSWLSCQRPCCNVSLTLIRDVIRADINHHVPKWQALSNPAYETSHRCPNVHWSESNVCTHSTSSRKHSSWFQGVVGENGAYVPCHCAMDRSHEHIRAYHCESPFLFGAVLKRAHCSMVSEIFLTSLAHVFGISQVWLHFSRRWTKRALI